MPLSRAIASADSFRCTSFAVPSRGEATAICTAAMPTPRAFLGLEEPLPDDDPTSDAPSRLHRHPRSAPCTDRRLSLRASLCRNPLAGPSARTSLSGRMRERARFELTVKTRMPLRPPIKATTPHPERLPSYRAATNRRVPPKRAA